MAAAKSAGAIDAPGRPTIGVDVRRLQHDLLERLRPATLRLAEQTLHHLDDRPRETQWHRRVHHIVSRELCW